MSRPFEPPVTVDDPGVLPADRVAEIVACFRRHVADTEGGMAFALYREGAPVLHVCGGVTARGGDRPWDANTLAVIFSGTKGLVATLAALLMDRGHLDPDALVADYWPEFAAAGKAGVRLHHVLAHTVGLPYVEPDPRGDESLDNGLMAQRLAAQEPLWDPGSRVAYHAVTFGYLMAEIIRRVTGRSVGEALRTELAEPFGLDVHLGLPEWQEPRVAPIFRADDYRISTFLKDDPERRAIVNRMYGGSLLADDLPVNQRAHHAAELAAGGALATAASMARLYSLLVGETPVIAPGVLARFTSMWAEGRDAINDRPVRFGLGYELADPIGTFGPVARAFGHTGAGGGVHGAWPDQRLGFSFLPNELRSEDRDRRARDLLALAAGEENP